MAGARRAELLPYLALEPRVGEHLRARQRDQHAGLQARYALHARDAPGETGFVPFQQHRGGALSEQHHVFDGLRFTQPGQAPQQHVARLRGAPPQDAKPGKAFDGLCSRNYFRAHSRRMADLHLRHGVHVLEFRGFDACGNAQLLAAVLNLFCGFLLDENLPGRAPQQNPERLKLSSLRGFDDASLRQEGQSVLRAARAALDGGGESFDLLEAMLRENDSYAARMKSRYAETGCIMDCISGQYSY